jgi:hypothetical protein
MNTLYRTVESVDERRSLAEKVAVSTCACEQPRASKILLMHLEGCVIIASLYIYIYYIYILYIYI